MMAIDEQTAKLVVDFDEIYLKEYLEIRQPPPPPEGQVVQEARQVTSTSRKPTTTDLMRGLALSGGGVRSASFCLGVLQALHAAGKFKETIDYLSTVSGGGYIGTSATVSMSYSGGIFPFGRTGHDAGETEETGHIRDNSRYLLQNGIGSAISAAVIYLRGITMNLIVLMPFLLCGAALLVALKPDTRRLVSVPQWLYFLPESVKTSGWAFSFIACSVLAALLVLYAIGVSIFPILKKEIRQQTAKFASVVLVILALPFILELHFAILRVMYGLEGQASLLRPRPRSGTKVIEFACISIN